MLKLLYKLLGIRTEKKTKEYSGISDFLLNASDAEKKEVITEAAKRANDDQLKVFNAARLKMGSN